MEKEQYRSVIRLLFLSGKKCEEIKPILDSVYGDLSPSRTTIYHWFAEFRRGRTSVFDEERPGAPKIVTTEENLSTTTTMDRIVSFDEVAGIENTPEVYLIDVREPKELKETGIIPGSFNIPLGKLVDEITKSDPKEFANKYGRDLPKFNSPIVFTCRSGRRAEQAMYDIEKHGYTNIKYYAGSWLEWESRHEPK